MTDFNYVKLPASGADPRQTAQVVNLLVDGKFNASGTVTLTNDNTCPIRGSGRYHRVRVSVTGDWRYALGVDIDASAMGQR